MNHTLYDNLNLPDDLLLLKRSSILEIFGAACGPYFTINIIERDCTKTTRIIPCMTIETNLTILISFGKGFPFGDSL